MEQQFQHKYLLSHNHDIFQGDRIANLATTVRHFISYYVSEGTYVGIVQFNSNASTLAGMTLVRGQTERDNLLRAVPTTAGGGTSIGAGIQQCQQVRLNLCKTFQMRCL